MTAVVAGALACALWAYLIVARGRFWLCEENDDGSSGPAAPSPWPHVAAVIPARNEARTIGDALRSLLRQRYAGKVSIVVVDDNSDDGTAELARRISVEEGEVERVTVIAAPPLPAGWAGKVWAQAQALEHLRMLPQAPAFVLLSDADIVYDPDVLSALVSRAQRDGLALSSRMGHLRCESAAERFLIPAFVFFFQMIYPFGWVNDPLRRTAAAAGGCMLVRWAALAQAGGLEPIRGAIIDDCALARRLKAQGPIRLTLTRQVRSVRPYPSLGDVRRMVARTAYTQLHYSPLLLAGTLIALTVAYFVPPALLLWGGVPAMLGAGAWAAMVMAFRPTLRLYGRGPGWALVLPLTALAYAAFTLESALRHARGQGGLWKGRTYR